MSEMMAYILLFLATIFVSSLSQVMLKKAAMRTYFHRWAFYVNSMVIGAYMVFLLVTFLTVYAYRVVPVSLGAALEGTAYLWVTILDKFFFEEPVTKRKLLGITLIITGTMLFVSGSESLM